MNPIFKQALCGLVFLCTLCTVQITSLSAQDGENPVLSLEARISYLGTSPIQSASFAVGNGDEVLTNFATNNNVALGVGLQKISANGWYSRHTLVQLAFSRATSSVRQVTNDGTIFEFTDGEEGSAFDLRLRYERGRYFSVGNSLQLGVGLMIDPFVASSRIDPFLPQSFPIKDFVAGLETGVVPQVSLAVSERVGVYLDAPLPVFQIRYNRTVIDNPFVFEPQRTETTGSADFTFEARVSLGLQVRL